MPGFSLSSWQSQKVIVPSIKCMQPGHAARTQPERATIIGCSAGVCRSLRGNGAMPVTDWRSEEAYSGLKVAEAEDLAWEWLRRDRAYQEDYRRLSRRERSSATADQFRRKWGLSFSS
ncbi:transcriptional regulator domain-containing protein [Bradyrhizobium elkanii]|uniref:transcriptional regulator domain-containing protein n=1 Tax=Bradyrhizobium elkanii TaxID=29448 RepID=UPI003BA94452